MKTILAVVFSAFGCFYLNAQALCSGSVDDPSAIVEDFGAGPNPGPELPVGASDYTYGTIGEGNYVVTNTTGLNGPLWHDSLDYTLNDTDGYMLLFDNDINIGNILSWTFEGLCPNTRYTFQLEGANIVSPSACGGNSVVPNIIATAYDASNGMVLEFGSRTLPVTNNLSWGRLQFSFDIGSTTSIEIRITNSAGAGCGNDFVLDDLRMLRCNYRITQDLDLCDFGGIYTIGNSAYSLPGSYIDTLYSLSTCNDTVVTTNLILSGPMALMRDTLYYCAAVGVEVNGQTYFDDRIVNDTLYPVPCLSIIEYQLLSLDGIINQQQFNLCPGDSLLVGSSIYTSAGVYLDTLTSSAGCDSIVETSLTQEALSASLLVNGRVVSSSGTALPAEVQITLGDSLQLEVQSMGFGIPTYSWAGSDQLSCPNCALQTFRPTQNTILTVTISNPMLTCTQTLSLIIEVLPCEAVYIPNAFSPNLDGVNDRFSIFPQACVRRIAAFTVFDRWGGQLYLSAEASGWDGTARGKAAEPGVYFYVVELVLVDGRRIERSGTLQLIR